VSVSNTIIMSNNTVNIDPISKNKQEQSSNTYYESTFHVYLNYKTDDDNITNEKTRMINYSNKYACFENIARIELQYANSTDIRFRNRYPTTDEMNELLSTYNSTGSIIKTYCSHSGEDKGFIYMKYLYAMEGYEQNEINKFMKIAYGIARKTNLSVDGPHCNVSWH
jgi:hypothetical protein